MRRILVLFAVPLVAFSLASCSDPQAGAVSPDAGNSQESASSPGSQELPPGHPPLEGSSPDPDIGQLPVGSGAGASGLTWKVPDGWQEVQPSSAMRKAEYQVTGEGGGAECVVFYFGPGQGGDAMTNALRWADQFSQPDGSSSRDRLVTEKLDVGGIPVLLTEVRGTYSGGMAMMGGPSQELAEYMLLGAVVEGPDANWFFKFTGPSSTVASQEAAFRSMIESVSSGN